MRYRIAFLMMLLSQGVMAQTNTFPASGNVGVGTVSPVSKLHVNGDITIGSGSRLVYDPVYDVHGYTKFDHGGMPESALLTYSYYGNRFQTRNGVAMVIRGDNNNMGIGTVNPVSKLHVDGDITIASGSRFVYDPVYDVHGYTKFDYSGMPESALLTYSYYGNRFQTRNGLAMVIRGDNNNVGIGTTAPTEKLTVNGNIRAKKLIVTQSGWSDYVFAKNYKLRPLAEVENYIKVNQHLPEVPSAKEVASKGINVGHTQALLLKKIEELTLYVIEQQKQIKALTFKNKNIELVLNHLTKSKNSKL